MSDFSPQPLASRTFERIIASGNRTVWIINIALAGFSIVSVFGLSHLFSSVVDYHTIISDPFDGAIAPIAYVPDWTNPSLRTDTPYADIPIDYFVPLPDYSHALAEVETVDAPLARRVFSTVYMGSYRGNHLEYDGSHVGIDIRAPEGTPVLAIANGVVIKAHDLPGSSGKYIVIRHDNVPYRGKTETYYSAYLHLSEIIAEEGKKITKGETLGRVGSTGISTAPHLEFQIDTADAPFHAYWPFTFREISDLGIDFFAAINMGVGKEKALRYSVHPIDFIRETSSGSGVQYLVESTDTHSVSIGSDLRTTSASSGRVAIASADRDTPTTVSPHRDPLADVAPVWRSRVAVLIAHGLDTDTTTLPTNAPITRRETLLLLGKIFPIPSDFSTAGIESVFLDIPRGDPLEPLLRYGTDRGIIGATERFRPDDTITRAEFVKIFIGFSGLRLTYTDRDPCLDVSRDSPFAPYIATFLRTLGLPSGRLHPGRSMHRGEIWTTLVSYFLRSKQELSE